MLKRTGSKLPFKLAATNCEFFCISISKITFSALSRSKICISQNFFVPLHPIGCIKREPAQVVSNYK